MNGATCMGLECTGIAGAGMHTCEACLGCRFFVPCNRLVNPEAVYPLSSGLNATCFCCS